MKLTRDIAKKQAKRIAANPMLTPQSEQGVTELVDCLMRNCTSPEHAERTMTVFLDTARDPRNLTAELADAARQSRQDVAFPPGCSRCTLMPDEHTGEPRYASHVPARTIGGYDCVVRCGCERGQALRARDRQRAAESQAKGQSADLAPMSEFAKDRARLAAGDRE